MLYIYYGTDKEKSTTKARTLVDSLRQKKPDAAFVKINSDDWNAEVLRGHLGGQGLFSNKYIIFIDNPSEKSEVIEELLGFLPAMNESDNIFIISDGKIKADCKKAYEKNAEKVVVTDLPSASGKSTAQKEFNIFALADALASRKSGEAWSIYRQAIDNEVEPESILGTLFWQVKCLIVANKTKSVSESGLSPFVYTKSKRGAANYSEQELADLSRKLVEIYHDAHRGLVNAELATERLLLTALKKSKVV